MHHCQVLSDIVERESVECLVCPSLSSILSHLFDDHKAPAGTDDKHLEALFESARPFLCDDLKSIDKDLPHLVSELQAADTGECWHKQGSFFDHLFGVYHILKMWKVPNVVCLLGIFHSFYIN